jgi:hypothetical protein
MIVNVYGKSPNKQYLIYLNSKKILDSYGLFLNFIDEYNAPIKNADADIYIEKNFKTTPIIPIRPTILEDCVDGFNEINCDLLMNPHVFSYQKTSLFKKEYLNDYNKNSWVKYRKSSFTEYDLDRITNYYDKLTNIYNFGMTNTISSLINTSNNMLKSGDGIELNHRPIDIMFIGRPTLSKHRMELIEELNKITNLRVVAKIVNNKIEKDRFAELLLGSKICISPWGYGETCFRDFEALLAMNILIKPDTSFSTISENLFRENDSVFWCKPDWSDLKSVIDRALSASTTENRINACIQQHTQLDKKYIANKIFFRFKNLFPDKFK